MKIVLDTNVLVAAFSTQGVCADVVDICLSSHQLYSSQFILAECIRIFSDKIKLPSTDCQKILAFLKRNAICVEPAAVSKKACRDIRDLPVLGTAVSANADFIITGDQDLLILKRYNAISIVSPREFISHN